MRSSLRYAIVLVLVVSTLALTGCTLPEDGGTDYPSESDVRERLTSLESLEADVEVTTDAGGNESSTRLHLRRDFETNRFRTEPMDPTANATTVVSNGTVTWLYEPTSRTVTVIENPETPDAVGRTAETIGAIYGQLDDGEADGSVGISPAPTVPTGTAEDAPDTRLDIPLGEDVSASAEGTETVDGRETDVVSLEVHSDDTAVRNLTYWIDQEWHFPLRSVVTVEVGDRTTVTETTYRNVTFDPVLEDEVFEFEPPANATVRDGTEGTFQGFRDYEELVAATDLDVPDPDLPEGYQFDQGEISPVGENEAVTLLYAGEEGTIVVTKLVGSSSDLENGEPVDVGGHDGRFLDQGTARGLVWTCEDDTYTVIGPDDDTMLAVGQSIGCQ